MIAPETKQALATHLRRMADNAGDQIDADRLSRAADLVDAPQSVRVKPLEWKECNSGNFKRGECFTAQSMVDFAPIAIHKKHDGWWLNKDCKTYATIEAAKAAAQADYDALILAALEPSPPAPSADVQALVEALQFYADPANWRDTPPWDGDPDCISPRAIPGKAQDDVWFCDCGDTARAALAAMKGQTDDR